MPRGSLQAILCVVLWTISAPAAVIRHVEVIRRPVFDAGELPLGVERVLNPIHTQTQESVIRRDLLFAEGDVLDTFLVAETERVLRARGYLGDVEITWTAVAADSVDVTVDTRDLWTLELDISPSGGGGAFSLSMGLSDYNFRGTGQEFEAGYTISDRRPSGFASYTEPAMFGTHLLSSLSYSAHGEGNVFVGALFHPFWAITVPWQYGIDVARWRDYQLFYKDREEAFDYPVTFRRLAADIAHASGDHWRFYKGGGVSWERRAYGAQRLYPDVPPELRAESTSFQIPDADRVVPSIGARLLHYGFERARYLDHFGRTEDFPTSFSLGVRAGLVSDALGSSVSRELLAAQLQLGGHWGPLWAAAEAQVEWESDDGDRQGSTRVGGRIHAYLKPALRHTLALRLTHDGWYRANTYGQMFLGANSGVRGLPARYDDGTRRWFVNSEYRYFAPLRVLTVDLGAVVFTDFGQVWNRGTCPCLADAVITYGIGLRLGLSKLTGDRVFRMDWAHGPDGWVTTFGFGMYFDFDLNSPLRFGT